MNFSSEQPHIIVVGSSSIDLVLEAEKIPSPNETVLAYKSESYFGGKGANQAVGTARLGASVYFIGCVGMDPLGQQIMRNLVNENVNVGFVHETDKEATGTAYVTTSTSGGNAAIVVVPAANKYLSIEHVEAADKYFYTVDLVLVQLEVSMEVIEYTVRKAKKYGKKVGLYASPATRVSDEILESVDFVVAKSNELYIVFGEEQREEILKKYFNKVFVRDDTNSTIYFDGTEMRYYRNDKDNTIHQMGMGDAFTSGFAVALCHGNSIEECVKFGNEVSLRASMKKGSQTGLPRVSDFFS